MTLVSLAINPVPAGATVAIMEGYDKTKSRYARWDATVAYHKPKYEIRLNLLNLTDEKFFDALIPSDGGRSVPGIGRTALMTLTYTF